MRRNSKGRKSLGELKARVTTEALRSDRPLLEIASYHQVHPNRVTAWKHQAIAGHVLAAVSEAGFVQTFHIFALHAGSFRLATSFTPVWAYVKRQVGGE